ICGRGSCVDQYCWNIEGENSPGWPGNKAVYEWSADCNSDGIVDYGQIRDGTFPDVNANGVPDCCEPGESCTPCPGDVTNGGTVDAADLSILLAAWGTNGQGEFDTDLNGDGLVDGGDLALVLGGWGACP
ncbi:MAG: Dockerin type domain, partial [Pseudomonadota bacterium]